MSNRRCLKLSLLSLALVSSIASAQYKWIDADGRVGYSDLIPQGDVKILKHPHGFRKTARASTSDSNLEKLPFELRKIAARFPVVLYTATICAPCDLARQYLARRGIPYTEKLVASNQDVAAFSKLGFDPSKGLPVITAGADKRTGYQQAQWDSLFTSAGYPKESRLPAGYQNPPVQALASEPALPSGEAPAQTANAETNGATDNAKPGFRF